VYAFLMSPIYIICRVFVVIDFIFLIIFGDADDHCVVRVHLPGASSISLLDL
jgi:hypothetical protein